MRSSTGVIAALVASAFAAPTTSPAPTCKNPVSQNANFDDITTIPTTANNPIPNPYKGLYFQGFSVSNVVDTGTGVVPGVFPHSPMNYATSSVRSTTLQGSAEFTTIYPNSKVKSFDLSSLYYGCVISLSNGAAALPVACNIAVTGYASGDNTASTVAVAAQSFSYNPSTNTGAQQMTPVTFNSNFKNLQYVLLQYTLPGGMAAVQPTLTLFIDDVKYRTCST